MNENLELAARVAQELEPAVQEFVDATGLLDPVRELAGWMAESIRYRKAPLSARLLMRSAEKIRATGLPPQAVSDRLLRAVLEHGSLEDDPEMQERWANLLAHEAVVGPVPPSFPEILRVLEPSEAQALDELVTEDGRNRSLVINPQRLPAAQFGNLERLGLVRTVDIDASVGGDMVQLSKSFPDQLTTTAFGVAFVLACRVPEKQASEVESAEQ